MKRGCVMMPASARIAGLKRSRWPTCRMRPSRSASSTSSRPVGDRGGHRLLDQDVDAVREQVVREREVQRRRYGEADAVDAAEERAVVGRRRGRAAARGDGARAARVDVDHRDQRRRRGSVAYFSA